MILKVLLLSMLFFTFSVSAKTKLLYFDHKLKPQVISFIRDHKNVISFKLFSSYHSPYFNRLWEIDFNGPFNELKESLPKHTEEMISEVSSQSVLPVPSDYDSHDPLFQFQWGVINQNHVLLRDQDDINSTRVQGNLGEDINVKNYLDRIDGLLKREVVVAVLDSGVDYDHEDLKDNIYKNLSECDSAGNPPFMPQIDNDSNGHFGDCLGWNFTAKGKGNNRPLDDKGHGTHVAGIISSVSNNKIGIRGISNKVKILPVKVLNKSERGEQVAKGLTDRVAKGILYSISKNVDVINLSLGWPSAIESRHVREAISEAYKKGIIIVAAAGNNSSSRPISPCSYKEVVCVGATSVDGDIAPFSNYGDHVDLLAPGEKILSTYPMVMDPMQFSATGYEIKNGTSQSAPFVSSLFAILKGIFTNATNDQILQKVYSSSIPIRKEHSAFGKINFEGAIKNTKGIIIPNLKDNKIKIVDNDRKSNIRIDFKNLFSNNVKVKIILKSSRDILIDNEIHFLNFSKFGETAFIDSVFELRSHDLDSEQTIDIHIEVDQKKWKFKKNIRLARSILEDQNLKTISFPEGEDVIRVFRNNKRGSKIQTVNDRFRSFNPEYWSYDVASKDLIIYHFNDNQFLKKSIRFPDSNKVLSILKLDLDYDSHADYLVRTLKKDDDRQIIQYHYLNSDLNYILKTKAIDFSPSFAFPNLSKSAFIPQRIDGKLIATPVFEFDGHIPQWNKNPDPWVDEDFSKKKRIYYLKYAAGQFQENLISDFKFNSLVSSLSNISDWGATLSIKGQLVQSELNFRAGDAHFIVSFGEETLQKYFLVKISINGSYSINPFKNQSIPLISHFYTPVTRLTGDVDFFHTTALVGLLSDSLGQYVTLRNAPYSEVKDIYRFNVEDRSDHIVGVMGSYLKNETYYSFYQTKTRLMVSKYTNSHEYKTFSYPIDRVSFISGSLFNEIFYPVVAGESDFRPAFYVDASQLHSNHAYVIELGENKIFSRVLNNILIPKECIAMNPVVINKVHHYSLLCQDDDKSTINYVPIY